MSGGGATVGRVTEVEPPYIRYRSQRPTAAGVHVGVFGLVNVLGRHGMLTEDEEATRQKWNAWYDVAYPSPTAANSDAYSHPEAVAWFKRAARPELLEPVARYLDILDAHRVAWERVESHDPGEVLYEDETQVICVPRAGRL